MRGGISAVGAEIHRPWLVGGEIRRFGVYQLDLGDLIGDVRGRLSLRWGDF